MSVNAPGFYEPAKADCTKSGRTAAGRRSLTAGKPEALQSHKHAGFLSLGPYYAVRSLFPVPGVPADCIPEPIPLASVQYKTITGGGSKKGQLKIFTI